MWASFSKIGLLVVVVLLCCGGAYAQHFEREGDLVTYRGNVFRFSERPKKETYLLTAEKRGDKGRVTMGDSIPIYMNDDIIYRTWEVATAPMIHLDGARVQENLFAHLTKDFSRLPDGIYHLDIHNVVMDKRGNIVFYEGLGILGSAEIPYRLKDRIDNKIEQVMGDTPGRLPARLGGVNVCVLTNILFGGYEIKVKNHHTFITKKWDYEQVI